MYFIITMNGVRVEWKGLRLEKSSSVKADLFNVETKKEFSKCKPICLLNMSYIVFVLINCCVYSHVCGSK